MIRFVLTSVAAVAFACASTASAVELSSAQPFAFEVATLPVVETQSRSEFNRLPAVPADTFASAIFTNPVDSQVSAFVAANRSRLFGGALDRAVSPTVNSELAALVHPLGDSSDELRSASALNLVRPISLGTDRTTSLLPPANGTASHGFLPPAVTGIVPGVVW